MKHLPIIFAVLIVVSGCTQMTSSNTIIQKLNQSGIKDCDIIFLSNMHDISAADTGFELFCIKDDGSSIARITYNTYFEAYPDLSPVKEEIVSSASFSDDGNTELVIFNFNGTIINQLTDNAITEKSPEFSPDGSKIVYSAGNEDKYNIYIIDKNTKIEEKLTAGSNDADPAFSPDNKIIFGRENKIMIMRDDGTFLKTLVELDGLYPRDLTYIDENTIAFSSKSSSTDHDIYLIDSDGNNLREISNNNYYDAMPKSINGKIIFNRINDDHSQIMSMNIDGSNQKALTKDNVKSIMPA